MLMKGSLDDSRLRTMLRLYQAWPLKRFGQNVQTETQIYLSILSFCLKISCSGSITFLKVNAKLVSPCARRCCSRVLASSTVGIWPAGTYHSTTMKSLTVANHSLRGRRIGV